MKKIIIITFLVSIFLTGFSQQYYRSPIWSRDIGSGNGNYCIQATIDTGFITVSSGRLSKLDKDGGIVWQQLYNASLRAVQQTSDSGYIVGGGKGWIDGVNFWAVKFDQEGNELWSTNILSSYGQDYINSIVETNDGGYFFAGERYDNTIKTGKLSNTGSLLWTKDLGNGAAYSVKETLDSSFYVAGKKNDDFWVKKLDFNGNAIWSIGLGGSDQDVARSILIMPDSGCLVAGKLNLNKSLVKLNKSGDTLWTKSYGVGEIYTISQTYDNGLLIGGNDGWFAKTDSLFNILWWYKANSNSTVESISESLDSTFSLAHTYDYNCKIRNWDQRYFKTQPLSEYNGDHSSGAFDLVISSDTKWWIIDNNDGDSISFSKLNGFGNDTVRVFYDAYHDPNYYWDVKDFYYGFHISPDSGENHMPFEIYQTSPLISKKVYGGSGDETPFTSITVSTGGYLIAGESTSNDGDVSGNHGQKDVWVIKIDSNYDTIWTKTFGGSGDEVANCISETSDGGFIIAGNSNSTDGDVWGNHGANDLWVIKCNSQGDTLWTRTYGGQDNDLAKEVHQTSDGGFIIAGYSTSSDGDVSSNYGGYDFWIVKIDDMGNITWSQNYGGTANDFAASIKILDGGGYIVTGSTRSNDYDISGNHGNYDYWVLEIDGSGTIVRSNVYGGSDSDYPHSITSTYDSCYLIGGHTYSSDGDVSGFHGDRDYWIIKINQFGDTIWTKALGGSGIEKEAKVMQASDGTYVITGYSNSTDGDVHGNHGLYDYWVVNLNKDSDTLWTVSFGGSDSDAAYSLLENYAGNYVICGSTLSNDGNVQGNHGGKDFWIVEWAYLFSMQLLPTQIEAGHHADSTEFLIVTNTNWSISENVDWMSVNPISGSGIGTVSVYYDTNYSYLNRSIPIKILSDILGTNSITITQSGDPSLTYFNTVWEENPFQAMNIIVNKATLNQLDLKSLDEIGVFDVDGNGNEICVGMGRLSSTITQGDPLLITASQDDPTTEETDGFQQGNTILFKFWDKSNQKEISAVVADYTLGFDDDFTPLGTALVELNGLTDTTQQIQLRSGWNIISFRTSPDNMDLENIVDPLINSSELIKLIDEKGDIIQEFPGIGWLNTIGDMANTEGYYIKTNTDTQFDVKGQPVLAPFDIPLSSGWNIISYPLVLTQNAKDAVQPLIDSNLLIKVIAEDGGFIQYIPGAGWMNTIGDFQQGEGYYIKVSDPDTLTLDFVTAKSSQPVDEILMPQIADLPYVNNPYSPMNIIVSGLNLVDIDIEEGDEIMVYDDGICVGAGVISYEKEGLVASIIASKNDPTTVDMDGFTEGHALRFKCTAREKESIELFIEDSWGQPFYEALGTFVCSLTNKATFIEEPQKQDIQIKCYPNPFRDEVNISIDLPEEGNVKVELMDIYGKSKPIVQSAYHNKGIRNFKFNTSGLPEGVYLVRLTYHLDGKVQMATEKLLKFN